MRIWNLKSLYLILSTSSNLWFFQISRNCKTPSLPPFPPCQASSCDPSSPSDGSPCACSQGPWPLPFSCSSPGTREETCNDSRQIQKRFQKEYTSCETAKHENVPNVTTFLLMLVDSNYIHTYQKRHEFQVSNKNLGASSHKGSHTTMNMEVSNMSMSILIVGDTTTKSTFRTNKAYFIMLVVSSLFLQKDHPKVAITSALTKLRFIKVLAVFGFRSNLVSDSACRILHLQSTKKWIPPFSSSPISSLLRQSPVWQGICLAGFFCKWNLRGVKEAGNPPKTKGGIFFVFFWGQLPSQTQIARVFFTCSGEPRMAIFSPKGGNPPLKMDSGLKLWKNLLILMAWWKLKRQGWTIIQRFILLPFSCWYVLNGMIKGLSPCKNLAHK